LVSPPSTESGSVTINLNACAPRKDKPNWHQAEKQQYDKHKQGLHPL
jgi:hypothetical protein